MPIDRRITPGLKAYRQRDYSRASDAWAALAAASQGEIGELSASLALLAGALARTGTRAHDLAAYEEALEQLAEAPSALAGVDVERLREGLAALELEDAAMDPPSILPYRRIPRRALLRFSALVAILLAGIVILHILRIHGYLSEARLTDLLGRLRASWWSPLALIGLFLVISPLGLPVSPVMLAGGIVFGTLWGSIYNLAGTVGGAAISYLLARSLGRDLIVRLVGERLRWVERLVKRHGFWTLARIRLIPIPFPIVNFGAALAGVPFGLFILSSALGLLPAMIIYTYFASVLAKAASSARSGVIQHLVLAVALVLAITFLPNLWRRWQRGRRLRRLLAQRQLRSSAGEPKGSA